MVLTLALALAVRIIGVYPGHNPYHPDEGKAGYISAREMYLNGNLKPLDFNYPALIPLTEYVMFRSITYPIIIGQDYLADPESSISNARRSDGDYFEGVIERYSDTNLLYWGRYFTACIGVASVFLVFWITRWMYSYKAGLFAALIMTVNYRSVMNSQLDLPDTYNAFYLLLAFAAIIKLMNERNLIWYVISGFLCGMAFSAKLQFFSLVPFGMVHIYLSLKVRNLRDILRRLISIRIVAAGAAFILAVAAVNYYELIDYETVYRMMVYQASKYGYGVMRFYAYGFSYLVKVALTIGVSLAVVGGMIKGMKRNRIGTILVVSVILSFLFYFLYLTFGAYYSRNFITIIPFFCILAGVGMWWVYEHLGIVLGVGILMLVASESIYHTFVHDFYYTRPWSLTEARGWLGKNVKEGSTIAAHPWDKYILFSLPSIDVDKNLKFINIAPSSVYSAAEIRDEGANYVLIGVDVLTDATSTWWMKGSGSYWRRPVKISKNTFAGLAAKELMQNTVHESVKPWQATDNNYVFVKIEDEVKYVENNYELLGVSTNENDWVRITGCLEGSESNLVYSDSRFGFESGYALYPVARWVSPILRVEGGYFYGASAKVSALAKVTKSDRDGFVRLDFYINEPTDWNEGSMGDWVYLSPRYYGESGAQRIEVFSEAPGGAEFMTVSYQVGDLSRGNYWFSDLAVYKSKMKHIQGRDQETFFYQLPDDLIVPYSSGGH